MQVSVMRVAATRVTVLLSLLVVLGGTPILGEIRDRDFLNDLRVGHWVEVRGEVDDDGTFLAERIEGLSARTTSALWGVAKIDTSGALEVLGRRLVVDDQTTWRGGDATSAHGRRVRVRGQLDARGRFVAERIDIRDPGVERISGRVDRVRQNGDHLELRLVGFDVAVLPPRSPTPRTTPRRARSGASVHPGHGHLRSTGS